MLRLRICSHFARANASIDSVVRDGMTFSRARERSGSDVVHEGVKES